VSYPKDLDEYTDAQLDAEITRRARLAQKGLCTYCGQPSAADPCKFPERHSVRAPVGTPAYDSEGVPSLEEI
jgi:hypothetical protein